MRAVQILLLIFITSLPALAETQYVYTIQIETFADPESAKGLAEEISHLLPVTLTIEKSGGQYNVRAGESKKKENLISYLKTLKKAGYNKASVLKLPSTDRMIVFEIPSTYSEESSSAKNPRALKPLQQPLSSQTAGEKSATKTPISEKKGQTNLLYVKTKEQEGTGLITRPQELPETQATGSQDEALLNLNNGWRAYKTGMFDQAIDYFKQASEYPGTSLNAKLGLAYSYIKITKTKEATTLLKELVEKRFLVQETLPGLLNLLIVQKDYGDANHYISEMSDPEKEIWRKKIEKSKSSKPGQYSISSEFNKAESVKDAGSLIKLTKKYQQQLNSCVEPEVFFKAAEVLNSDGSREDARQIYYDLLSACHNKWDLRVGILYELKTISEYHEIKKLVDAEIGREGLPDDYTQQVNRLKINILKERIANIPSNDEEAGILAEEILAINPGDQDALMIKGWRNFNTKNYKRAYEIFSELHGKHPENRDYATGLIYVLIELNKENDALSLIERSDIEKEKKEKLESAIYLKTGGRLYKEKNYAEAEPLIRRALTLDPENKDAEVLLAWTLYNQNKFDEAVVLFSSVYEKDKEANIADAILNTYEKSGKRKDAFKFSSEIGKTSNESLQGVSGKYFAAHDMPITASQIDSDPEAPYHNADKPYFSSVPSFTHKSGDSGISELNDLAIPVSFLYPYKWGNDFRFSVTTHWLYSGSVPSSPFVGTAPEGGVKMRDLINSIWVFTPEISYGKEGYIDYNLSLGLTPLNGPVYSLPTFNIEAKQKLWRLNIHQNSVTESILSYIGLDDPYSSKEWGRVLQTGAEAELNLTPFPHYWLSLTAGYDYYWGKNVEGNNSIHGTLSLGRTFRKNPFDISPGLFVTSQHFQNNSNFFTYGHGGYFSPDLFIMTGPTLSIATNSYKSFRLKAQATAGYLYFRTEDTPFLPLGDNNSGGVFKGENASRIGYDLNIETLKLITSHMAVGVFGDVNRSADFTQWSAGLTIRYYPSSRVGLVFN